MTTELWLIRHGETAWNAQTRFQGHLDIPLNETGLRQAAQLGVRVGALHREHPYAALVTSDLKRATQTADALTRHTGLSPVVRVGLRERNYGFFSALTPPEMEAHHPEAFARWRARDVDFVIPEGESLSQLEARVVPELRALASQHRGARVLVVAHGGVLDSAYRAACGIPLEHRRAHALHNASLNLVRVHDDGRFEAGFWGDITHLEATARDEV
jgi:probable phosphoglycerate mutase